MTVEDQIKNDTRAFEADVPKLSPRTAPTALKLRKRAGTSMVVRKVSVTTGPTPGMVISRRHTSSSRTIASKRRCRTAICSRTYKPGKLLRR
jgi:hypothetical protein